jgi:malonyl-CoA decarboxylase
MRTGYRCLSGISPATYDIDATSLANAARHYGSEPDAGSLAQIATLAEPRWQELFRRLNGAENGTVRLVRLRERLQVIVNKDSDPAHSDAARIDAGLGALLRMWFNPGFLVLQPIDWSTPANILEKIIAYEAVHEITSWDALRARLAPEDRRCFAFFHPRMPEEPLIFVEVALTDHTPASIEDVLQIERQALSPDDASTAVFYSISNCQAGLAGISFGNFLIKRVAQELRLEHPALTTFVTLSPVPGLMRWLRRETPDLAEQFAADDKPDWPADADSLELAFTAAALRYFTRSDRPDGWPNDPVARFHLGNGAILEQINYGADKSPKGLGQSGGLMVNYRYDLDVVEANHEAFHETKSVLLSPALKTAMKSAKS